MNKHNLISITVAVILSTVILFPSQAGAQSAPAMKPTSLVGVWRVTRHGVDCNTGQDLNSFNVLMTFHRDHTLTAAGASPGSGLATGTNEYGVWSSQGGTYSFHDVSYGYDENGNFTGSAEVTATLQLTSADTFSYTSTICVFDPNGNQLFCFCGRADGTRFQ